MLIKKQWSFYYKIIIFCVLAFHLAFLNSCTSSKSGEDASSNTAGNTEGNGKTYDGKIRIVHRYDEKEKIYCNEVEIPKDVLYRETESDRSWYLLVNKQNCKQDLAVHVDQVSYDDNLKVATYKGLKFYPPKSLNVNPKENPDLPDINVNDGLCIDENGLCSLRAATEQASYISATTEVIIKLLAGSYPILKPLEIHFPKAQSGHQIYFEGAGQDKTIIDGQSKTSHLIVDGSSGGLNISNLSFIRGSRLTAFSSSSILPYYFNGILNIDNCLFEGNSGQPAIYVGSGNLGVNIRKSVFKNNQTSTNTASVEVFSSPLLVEDTYFVANLGMGLKVSNRSINVNIRRSTFSENGSFAVYFYQCEGCSLENSTIVGNKYGLSVTTSLTATLASSLDVYLTHMTMVNNGDSEFGNLHLALANSLTKVRIENSVLSNGNTPAKLNCTNSSGFSSVVANNSLIDDNSCLPSGLNNLIAIVPMLSSTLANNGGYTPTLLPNLGSPLLGAGNLFSCLPTDQRSIARSGACDIGSVQR